MTKKIFVPAGLCAAILGIALLSRPNSQPVARPATSAAKTTDSLASGLSGTGGTADTVQSPSDSEKTGESPTPATAQAAAAAAEALVSQASAAEAAAAARIPDMPKVLAFGDFSKRWMAATPEEREGLKAEGLALAQARRPEFKKLIVADPRRAIIEAVPRVVLQDLPAEITAVLEKPVSDTGTYSAYFGRPADGRPLPPDQLTLRYFETASGASYKANVFGEMENVMSKKDVPLRGVAIDRELAVAESPVRRLETGERVGSDVKVETFCPVSGIESEAVAPEEPVTDESPAVEIGSRVILLCNGSHVTILDEQYKNLLQASGPGGAGFFNDNFPGTSSEAIGNFRCLYLRVTYQEQLSAPNTEDGAYGDMRNVSRYFLENSYGRLTTTTIVSPLIVLPHTQAWYIAKDAEVDGLGLVHSDSRAEARKLGYDSHQFNCTIVRVNGGPRLSGISWGGGDSVWASWDGMDVLNHECGHSLGRNHANYWKTTDGTAYGQGANEEYGNPFDVMGNGSGFGAHYNSMSKRALGWLPDPYVNKPATNGTYRIYAYDQPELKEGQRYTFRVDKNSAQRYVLEYHPANSNLTDSAVVIYSLSGQSNAGHLLDTTQGSSGGKNDGGIQIGRTYDDPEADMHFTVVSKNATSPPSLDLVYNQGPFPGNRPPDVTLTASATTIAAGGSVTFTANATDPDGDTLAYHWDFNDGVPITNTRILTRTFAAADQMTVMLTVSDMKGGSTRRHVLINVGAHGRRTIVGSVKNGTVALAGVRISDGTKYCFTDSDGNYILSDLTTGSHTLTAALPGYDFTAGFTNPFNVTTATNTGNWTATPKTLVTLTKTADAKEGGPAGTFTLTRTGSTAAALAVRVTTAGGTATYGTDYSFAPNYAVDGLYQTFNIPAGAASLPITVNAVNDTSAEGPETISLSVVTNGSYWAGAANYAVMTLEDNDTTLPKVSVTPTGQYAHEAPFPTDGEFTFARTGDPASPLTINVSWSGSAGNGQDFTALPNTVTFPAGAATVKVPVAVIDDALIETPESCVATISSGATYIRDSSLQTATVNITDDDTPVVTVTAADSTASEANEEPGVFLITCTGSTAQPLKIYYGLSGSALHGTDYAALPGEVIIPAGATSAPVVVTPYDDDLGEPETQSVVLNLTTFDNAYSLGTPSTSTINITDNDDTPVVSVRADTTRADTTPTEPSTTGTFLFRAVGSATGNVTVHYTVSGTATAGVDYTALSGTVSVPANGSNDVTVNIPVRNDTIAEDSETIIVTITPGTGYRVYNDGTATAVLKDDERSQRIIVSTGKDTPAEGGSAGAFYLSRSSSTGSVTVSYTMSGTAENGVDYTKLSGTATIADGATGVDIPVTPINDTVVEGTETITLTINTGTNYGAGVPGSATLYLNDNETPPLSVRFATAGTTISEAPSGAGGAYHDIPVQLSAASTNAVTVEYTSAGGTAVGDGVDWGFADAAAADALIPGGVLTFAPGTTTANIRVWIKDDGVIEGSETALLALNNARFARVSGTNPTHTITITDANNPVPRFRFLTATSNRFETDGSDPMLMVLLDRPTDKATTVKYSVSGTATSGKDFNLAPGTLTFAAGQTFKILPLSILTDTDQEESPETVIITLTDPTNATLGAVASYTLTITESTKPVLAITATKPIVDETAATAEFVITRTGTATTAALSGTYTFSGSAVEGADFTPPSGSFTIPAGASTISIPITLIDDQVTDGDKTLTLLLASSSNYVLPADPRATLTIVDNDRPPVLTITEPALPQAVIPTGMGLIVKAEAHTASAGDPVSVPVTWSVVSGPGTATASDDTGGRTAITFTADGDYHLQASATAAGLTSTAPLLVRVGAAKLTAQNIGSSTAAGSWAETDAVEGSGRGGKITLSGAGTGLSTSGTSDGFRYLATTVSGDFDVRCRLISLTNPGASSSCRVGIMARATTAANSVYAMSIRKVELTPAFHARITAGADPYDYTGGTAATLPTWLRLVRQGDDFSAWTSDDGNAWEQQGNTQTIPLMGANPLLGLALTSAVTATASTAVVDNYTGFLPTNIGPVVDAGSSVSGPGPWTLNGTVTDDGRPAPSVLTTFWHQATGPGSSGFGNATALSTSVLFSASGEYRLRLSAGDGLVTTFADTTASVTLDSGLAAWRLVHFGTPEDTGDAANSADPDHDGLPNLMEYTLGSLPKEPSVPPLLLSREGDHWNLTFPRKTNNPEVILTLQTSDDLTTWTAIAHSAADGGAVTAIPVGTSVTETPGAGGNSLVQVSVPAPDGTDPNPAPRFFRLHSKLNNQEP